MFDTHPVTRVREILFHVQSRSDDHLASVRHRASESRGLFLLLWSALLTGPFSFYSDALVTRSMRLKLK